MGSEQQFKDMVKTCRAAGVKVQGQKADLIGVVLLVAGGFVLMNFIVDMLYAVLDPRIRHGHA